MSLNCSTHVKLGWFGSLQLISLMGGDIPLFFFSVTSYNLPIMLTIICFDIYYYFEARYEKYGRRKIKFCVTFVIYNHNNLLIDWKKKEKKEFLGCAHAHT